jgi:tetratricopeptide (TPR) repeat protein
MTRTLHSRFFLACLALSISFSSSSQSLKDHLQKADRYFSKKDYKNALVHLKDALALDPDDPMANYKAGVASIDQKQYSQAAACLEKAYQARPDIDPDIRYHLAVALQNDHQYAKAKEHYEAVKVSNKNLSSLVTRKIRECVAGDSLINIPITADVSLLTEVINTTFTETAPLIVADGMIFTSNRSADAYALKSRTNTNDVYIARVSNGEWAAPEKIPGNINAQVETVATSISSDGKTLLLYYPDGNGDIYSSTYENGAWSKPVALNRFINNPDYRETAAALSPDGQRLYFSSNRPGGRGGFDIYVSERDANGQWGRPSNLGPTINTRGDEMTPFIHADGKTLYFSSNGHATLGDADIFKSTLEGGKWTRPENLGYPVNTSAYEGFFVLSPTGDIGYFTSRRKDGQSDSDIYQANIRQSETSQKGDINPQSN